MWQYYGSCQLNYVVEGNKIITDVVKLLLGGGTFLFALTGALFGSNILLLPLCLKILLIVSWGLIFISFIFGIRQLISDSSFLGAWSGYYSSAMKELSKDDGDDKGIEKIKKIFEDKKTVSDMNSFWLQVCFMAISFIIQIAVVSISLFLEIN